jgi:hypothetical protein
MFHARSRLRNTTIPIHIKFVPVMNYEVDKEEEGTWVRTAIHFECKSRVFDAFPVSMERNDRQVTSKLVFLACFMYLVPSSVN